ncbi:MAG: hypothetical protein NUK62_02865 [Tenericutes bacterium]|nr:hypothetical protein [Mycoplasmatota bacterium]
MMYKSLVKLFFKENFSLKRLMGFDTKKSKVKAVLIGLAIIYAIAVFVGAFGYMFFDLGRILSDMGQPKILLSFLTIYSLGLAIIIVLLRASGSLFYYKDYDILSPLPIHPRTILMAKITVLLTMLYVSSFIFTLPIAFSYFYWTGFSILSILYYLIAFIFVPLVPFIVMTLISLLIAIITSRFRKNKIINIIIMFAVFIGIFMFTFSINDVDVNPLTGQIELFAGITNAYPPFKWFMNSIHDHNVIDLILLVCSHALLFGIFVYFIQGIVHQTNQKGIRSNTRKNGSVIKYQQRSVLMALVQKEFKKFFSITLYAVNAGLGPVIMIVLSIASLFYKTQLEASLSEIIGVGLDIEIMIMILIGFSISMTYTPAISLSLEGKNFWIVKSLPIESETIVLSKILFNILLALPIAIFSMIIFGYTLGISIVNQLLLIVLFSIFTITISSMDAIINLHVPKFDFVNEVEVIKQSAGALLGVFGGFTAMILNGVLFYLLNDLFNLSIIVIFMIILNILLSLFFIYYIRKNSSNLLSKMKA